jgi:hypothetical protein
MFLDENSGVYLRLEISKMVTKASSRVHWHPCTHKERELVRQELEVLLQSPLFTSSKRYPAFLRYVVEKEIDGLGDSLKERTLGVEVFHKSPGYDTNEDTIVRFVAGEVRKRLELLYSQSDEQRPIQISLSARSYVPQFFRISANDADSPEASPIEEAQIPTESTSDAAPSTRWLKWMAILCGSALAVLAALAWYLQRPEPQKHLETVRHDDAVAHFWQPIEALHTQVLLCVGTVVSSNTRNYRYAVATKNDAYPFLSLGSADAIADISSLFGEHGTKYFLQSAPAVNLMDLQAHPAVLIGAYNNEWTLQLANNLRLRFSPRPKQQIYDSKNPSLHWERSASPPYTTYNGARDFAIVARYHDSVTDNVVVIIAGLGINGTIAAAKFATSPEYLRLLESKLGPDWERKNVEVLLETSVIKNEFGEPFITTVYVW